MKATASISWAGGLVLAALLGAGCRRCGASESGPAQYGLAFSTDTLGVGKGFRRAEVATAYLVRYTNADYTQPLDTVRALQKPGNFFYVDRRWFCILPFTGSNPPRSYRLEVPAARRRYDITDIVLQYGSVEDCTRTIARLDALVNGQRRDGRQGDELTK